MSYLIIAFDIKILSLALSFGEDKPFYTSKQQVNMRFFFLNPTQKAIIKLWSET